MGKVGTIDIENVLKIHPAEYHDVLLGNQYAYITEDGIYKVRESLILVKVSDLIISYIVRNYGGAADTVNYAKRTDKRIISFVE